jgi:hypothetical protein
MTTPHGRPLITGIPSEVACPHCGGYVRGHLWIATDTCSVMTTEDVFEDAYTARVSECEGDDIHEPQVCALRDLIKRQS